MSVVAYAIRTCLWRALYEKTSAGKLVFDSSIDPLDELLKGVPSPVIIISTEDETAEVDGFRLTETDRELTLIVVIAIGTAMADQSGFKIEQTDEGLEQSLNYLVRQVTRVMQVDEGIWGDLFRSFAGGIVRITSQRGTNMPDTGVKFAARQLQIVCEPLSEPPFGEAPTDEWARLLSAMQADTEMFADEAPGLEAEIIGAVVPTWAQLQARLGHRRGALAGVGIGPLIPAEEPVPVTKFTSVGDHLESEVVPDA